MASRVVLDQLHNPSKIFPSIDSELSTMGAASSGQAEARQNPPPIRGERNGTVTGQREVQKILDAHATGSKTQKPLLQYKALWTGHADSTSEYWQLVLPGADDAVLGKSWTTKRIRVQG